MKFSTKQFASICTESALSYLDEYAKGDKSKPFFCYVAYTAPHDPRSPSEDYIGKYPEKDIPLPGNYKPVHPFDYGEAQVRDENLAGWPRTPEVIKSTLSDYYGLISHLDARIGDLIKSLKDKDLFKNTIIVFAADNGLAVGSHGLLGKQSLYEHSMKVPFVITGPGIPENRKSEALVYLYDIFPTLASEGDTVAYTAKNILPMKYEPEKFERTMDKNQPPYTQDKYWKKQR